MIITIMIIIPECSFVLPLYAVPSMAVNTFNDVSEKTRFSPILFVTMITVKVLVIDDEMSGVVGVVGVYCAHPPSPHKLF